MTSPPTLVDQFAKPGILPRFASKRARQSRTTFVATSTCVLVAAAHPCAGAVLQTALYLHPVVAECMLPGVIPS